MKKLIIFIWIILLFGLYSNNIFSLDADDWNFITSFNSKGCLDIKYGMLLTYDKIQKLKETFSQKVIGSTVNWTYNKKLDDYQLRFSVQEGISIRKINLFFKKVDKKMYCFYGGAYIFYIPKIDLSNAFYTFKTILRQFVPDLSILNYSLESQSNMAVILTTYETPTVIYNFGLGWPPTILDEYYLVIQAHCKTYLKNLDK